MRKTFYKATAYLALVMISPLSLSMDIFAGVEKQNSSMSSIAGIDKSASVTKRKIQTEKEQQIVKEAAEAVSSVHEALETLSRNDSKKAFFVLQTASEKLDAVMAKQPALALVSADVEVDVSDFQGDAETVKKAINEADDLLENGKVQAARQILAELASEIRITTVSMPLSSFSTAIKNAMARVNNGETKEAASLLNEALSTLVETVEIIPLPFLRAEALLNEASDLEHKKDMSKEKSREEVLTLTESAKDQLKVAELLGYGDKDAFKRLYLEIDDIKETLHSTRSVATWKKIKQKLAELKDKVIHSKQ